MMNLIAFVTLNAGWLEDITNFIRRQLERFWTALVDFLRDLVIWAIEQVMTLVLMALDAVGIPDFMKQYNLGSLLGQAGSTVGWFVETFKIAECLGVIGSAIAFRILRKILTMGKW